MRTPIIFLAAALAAGCTAQGNSALLISKVVVATAGQSSDTPPRPTCTVDPSADESNSVPLNLTENTGTVGAVISNLMLPTNSANPDLNVDASTFSPHQAVVTYEFPSGAAGGTINVNPVITPVSGLTVAAGNQAPVLVSLVPQGVITAPKGTFIRASFHIEGKMTGGNTTRTTEREFLFVVCDTSGCGPACL